MKLIWLILLIFLIIVPTQSVSENIILATQEYSISRVDTNTLKFKGNMVKESGFYLVMAASGMDIKTIILDSPGGLMYEASIIAGYLDDAGVSVLVEKGTMCVSACAYAAIRAKSIDLQGKLVFHPPFFPIVSTTDSLYSIIHMSNTLTLDLATWFLDAGYSISLLELIFKDTSNENFMVFDNYDNLIKFKSNNAQYLPDNFTELYTITSSETLFK